MSLKDDLETIRKDLETKKFREGEAGGLLAKIQEEQMKVLAPLFEKLGTVLADNMVAQFEKITKALTSDVLKVDFTETNKLLKGLKDEINKPCEVNLTLE